MGVAVTRGSENYMTGINEEIKILSGNRKCCGLQITPLPHRMESCMSTDEPQPFEARPRLQLALFSQSLDQLSNNYRASKNFLRFTLDKMSTCNNSDFVGTEHELDL